MVLRQLWKARVDQCALLCALVVSLLLVFETLLEKCIGEVPLTCADVVCGFESLLSLSRLRLAFCQTQRGGTTPSANRSRTNTWW
jgi:hypothetical protein